MKQSKTNLILKTLLYLVKRTVKPQTMYEFEIVQESHKLIQELRDAIEEEEKEMEITNG